MAAASDVEVVARTIMMEAYHKGRVAYDAVAWGNRAIANRSYWGGNNPRNVRLDLT